MALTPSRELAQAMLGGGAGEAWDDIGGADGITKRLAARDAVAVTATSAFRAKFADRLVKINGGPVKGDPVKEARQ